MPLGWMTGPEIAKAIGDVMIDPYEAWCEESEKLWKERAEMFTDIENKVSELEHRLDQLEALKEIADHRLELLERLEWDDYSSVDGVYCSICGNTPKEGHADDCELAWEIHGTSGSRDQ